MDLCGYFNNKVDTTQPTSIADQKERMSTDMRNIPTQTKSKMSFIENCLIVKNEVENIFSIYLNVLKIDYIM